MTDRNEALDQFVILTRQRTGAETEAATMKIIEAALGSLGRMLPDREAAAVKEQLPEPLGRMLDSRRREGQIAARDVPRDLARQEGTDADTAKEHAVEVCQVLLESLDADLRTHLRSSVATLCDFFSIKGPAGPGRPPKKSGPGEGKEAKEKRAGGFILTGLRGTLAERGATTDEREQGSALPPSRKRKRRGEPRRERVDPGEQFRGDEPPNVKRD